MPAILNGIKTRASPFSVGQTGAAHPGTRVHRRCAAERASRRGNYRYGANLVSNEVGRIRGARCGSGRPTLSEQEVLLLGGNRIFDRSAQAGSFNPRTPVLRRLQVSSKSPRAIPGLDEEGIWLFRTV